MTKEVWNPDEKDAINDGSIENNTHERAEEKPGLRMKLAHTQNQTKNKSTIKKDGTNTNKTTKDKIKNEKQSKAATQESNSNKNLSIEKTHQPAKSHQKSRETKCKTMQTTTKFSPQTRKARLFLIVFFIFISIVACAALFLLFFHFIPVCFFSEQHAMMTMKLSADG